MNSLRVTSAKLNLKNSIPHIHPQSLLILFYPIFRLALDLVNHCHQVRYSRNDLLFKIRIMDRDRDGHE